MLPKKSDGGIVQKLETKVTENAFFTFILQIEQFESGISTETSLQPLQCPWFWCFRHSVT